MLSKWVLMNTIISFKFKQLNSRIIYKAIQAPSSRLSKCKLDSLFLIKSERRTFQN